LTDRQLSFQFLNLALLLRNLPLLFYNRLILLGDLLPQTFHFPPRSFQFVSQVSSGPAPTIALKPVPRRPIAKERS